jgi:hypothetical protein
MTISLWFMAWTPYLVINYTGIFESAPISPLATIWGSLFAKANAVYNPIVYGIRSVSNIGNFHCTYFIRQNTYCSPLALSRLIQLFNEQLIKLIHLYHSSILKSSLWGTGLPYGNVHNSPRWYSVDYRALTVANCREQLYVLFFQNL